MMTYEYTISYKIEYLPHFKLKNDKRYSKSVDILLKSLNERNQMKKIPSKSDEK